MTIVSIVVVAVGAALIYLINRRKFNRRNEAGVEIFENYEKAFLIRLLEKIGTFVGYALIIFGVVYGCVQSNVKKQEERKMEAAGRQ